MSLINFQSSTEIEKKKKWERDVRSSILEKAKKKYEARELKEAEAKKRGEDKWLLPSVEAAIEGTKSKKKSKKDKKSKKKKKKRECSSTSSSSENEEQLWIEKKVAEEDSTPAPQESAVSESQKREEWMQVTSLFGTYSREDLRTRKEPKKSEKQKNELLSSSRELNPYYKSGGSGLPSAETVKTSAPSLSYDAAWLRKALRRAKDQAEADGTTLEEVAASRWGSLDKFYELLSEAERKEKEDSEENARGSHRRLREERDRPHRSSDYRRDSHRHRKRRKRRDSESSSSTSSSDRGRSRSRDRKDHPQESSRDARSTQRHSCAETTSRSREAIKGMMRPPSDEESAPQSRSCPRPFEGSRSSKGGWRKKTPPSVTDKKRQTGSSSSSSDDSAPETTDQAEGREESDLIPTAPPTKPEEEVPCKILTEKEMNHLAARMTKAELLGNEPLASKLKAKLEAARAVRDKAPSTSGNPNGDAPKTKEEVVVLTRTDGRGATRPVSIQDEATRGKSGRKKPKLFTHDKEGKRTLYFPDDERYNLQQMFEKEKGTSAAEQNALFERAAMANVERLTDDFDMDDMFVSKAALRESLAKQQERDRRLAIKEHQASQKTLESCVFCIENKEMKKHLIVSLGAKCYLSLPAHEPLSEGHCIIAPISHVASSTRVDEDVWQEVMELRSSLVKMFEAQDEDCLFFETCRSYRGLPHMTLHCVPLAREVGDLAPIYFKKAIQECEEEWAQNKKLVDLRGKDVRRAVPKELPYFFVDFGLSPGFAHVIEDEKTFRSNFAQEIIGGMLDADPRLWRKPKVQPFEAQRKRVVQFAKRFEEYDPNRR